MAEIVVKLVNGELAGKTVQSLKKEIREAQLAADKAVVGTKAWVDAHAKLDKAKALQADLKKQIEATTTASESLKTAWNNLPGAQYFNQVAQSFGLLKSGVGGLITQMGVLKTAILATGLGALVITLGSLYAWMKRTDDGAVFLEGAINSLSNTATVLYGRLINIRDGNFFKGLSDDIDEAANQGLALSKMMDNIDDKRREIELGAAEAEKSITQLLLQSRNVSLTYQERIDLLDEASKKEEHALKRRQFLNDMYIQAIQKEMSFAEKHSQLEDALKDKLNEALIKKINLEKDSITLQEKIENRRSALLEKRSTEEERAAEKKRLADERAEREAVAALNKRADEELEGQSKLQELKIALMDEGVEKEIAKIELDTKRKIAAAQGEDETVIQQLLLLEEEKNKRIQAVRDKAKADQEKKDEKARQEKIQKETAEFELDLARDLNRLNERFLSGQLTEEQYMLQSEQLALSYQQRKLEMIRAANGEESIEYQKAYAEYLRLQQETSAKAVDIKKKELADQMAATSGAAGVFGDFFGVLAQQQKQGTAQWKAFATAQAIMGAISGATNAYSSTAAIPIVGPTLAPLAAGIALAAGMANVRRIQATKVEPPVKKELGGMLYGPRHSQGGIPIEAEGGEFIFSRKAVNAIGAGTLTKINDHFTKKMETGGPVNPFPDRNSLGRMGAQDDVQQLKMAFMQYAEATNQRFDRIKVQNVVTETRDAINVVNNIQEDADV